MSEFNLRPFHTEEWQTFVSVYWPKDGGYGAYKLCDTKQKVESEIRHLLQGGYGVGKHGRIHVIKTRREVQELHVPEDTQDKPEPTGKKK